MNPYRKLTAPELVDLFVKVCEGYVIKPRDARMLRLVMDEHGVAPPQIVLGFYVWRSLASSNDIPTFISLRERWFVKDKLEAEAELCRLLSGRTDTDYALYMDLRDTGASDARLEQIYREAKERLEEHCGLILDLSLIHI